MLKFYPFTLQLKEPFNIAAGVRTSTPIVLVEWHFDDLIGYGEASLPPYLGESQESAIAFLNALQLEKFHPVSHKEEILEYIRSGKPGNNAAKASVDIALHDLIGKMTGKSLSDLLHIKKGTSAVTSLTLGIASAQEVERKFEAATDFKILKVKLGSENDDEVIKIISKIKNKPFGVDVNQGWRDKKQALEWARQLENSSCQYIEQPFSKDNLKDAKWLKDQISIPVIADEAVKTFSDMEKIKGSYSGINIKLMKSTGIAEAIRMIKAAREMDLKIVLGSMTETTCGLSAAAHLAPLADWVDLDSQFLTANDPFTGMKVKNGVVLIDKNKSGTGAEKVITSK